MGKHFPVSKELNVQAFPQSHELCLNLKTLQIYDKKIISNRFLSKEFY
jgi:hypothetical protein